MITANRPHNDYRASYDLPCNWGAWVTPEYRMQFEFSEPLRVSQEVGLGFDGVKSVTPCYYTSLPFVCFLLFFSLAYINCTQKEFQHGHFPMKFDCTSPCLPLDLDSAWERKYGICPSGFGLFHPIFMETNDVILFCGQIINTPLCIHITVSLLIYGGCLAWFCILAMTASVNMSLQVSLLRADFESSGCICEE